MSKKFTPWYPAYSEPARIGYYDTRNHVGEMVLFWDGGNWRASEHSPRGNASTSFWRGREWRGLIRPTAFHNNMFALAA